MQNRFKILGKKEEKNFYGLLTKKIRRGIIHKVLLYADSCKSVVLTVAKAYNLHTQKLHAMQQYFFKNKRNTWMCGIRYLITGREETKNANN